MSLDERVVAAATELAAVYGDSRMTVEDVAKRSGVSRATIFRRFGSKDRLLDEVNLRSMRAAISPLDAIADAARGPVDGAVELFVAIVIAARRHPRVQRLSEFERDRVLDAAVTGDPSPLELGRGFIEERLSRWQESGHLRGADTARLADFLAHLVVSYVLAPSASVDVDNERDLRAFAAMVVAPVFQAA